MFTDYSIIYWSFLLLLLDDEINNDVNDQDEEVVVITYEDYDTTAENIPDQIQAMSHSHVDMTRVGLIKCYLC